MIVLKFGWTNPKEGSTRPGAVVHRGGEYHGVNGWPVGEIRREADAVRFYSWDEYASDREAENINVLVKEVRAEFEERRGVTLTGAWSSSDAADRFYERTTERRR